MVDGLSCPRNVNGRTLRHARRPVSIDPLRMLHGSESGVNPRLARVGACRVQARDALALLAAIDWTPIVVALITLAGSVFNALLARTSSTSFARLRE
jgi:hypothetical protein